MLNILLKNGFNKDPRGRILGSVKMMVMLWMAVTIGACYHLWNIFLYGEIEIEMWGQGVENRDEEQKRLQNRRDDSL